MWKMLFRGTGLMIGFLAAMMTFFGYFARVEAAGELDYLVELDGVIGGMFAVVLFLVVAPSLPRASIKWYAVLVDVAAMIWLGVSSVLIWHHEEQVRILFAAPQLIHG